MLSLGNTLLLQGRDFLLPPLGVAVWVGSYMIRSGPPSPDLAPCTWVILAAGILPEMEVIIAEVIVAFFNLE